MREARTHTLTSWSLPWRWRARNAGRSPPGAAGSSGGAGHGQPVCDGCGGCVRRGERREEESVQANTQHTGAVTRPQKRGHTLLSQLTSAAAPPLASCSAFILAISSFFSLAWRLRRSFSCLAISARWARATGSSSSSCVVVVEHAWMCECVGVWHAEREGGRGREQRRAD